MYETSITVERIKLMAKQNGIVVKTMLEDCGLNKNVLSSMQSRGSWLQSNSLAKITDYLNCSVDYLLGRTDTPTGTYSINGNNNVQVNGHNGDHSPLTVNNTLQLDEMERNLIEAFRMLDFPEKIEAISGLIKKAQKKAPSKDGDN